MPAGFINEVKKIQMSLFRWCLCFNVKLSYFHASEMKISVYKLITFGKWINVLITNKGMQMPDYYLEVILLSE